MRRRSTSSRGAAFRRRGQSAGVTHAYTGDFDYFVGGGVAAFDCNADGLLDLYFAGGSQPAALFVNRSAAGGALAFERRPVADDGPDGGHRRLPDRHRQRRHDRPRGPAPRRERAPARHWVTASFERANEDVGLRRRRRLDDRVQCHVGGGRGMADAWPSATTSARTDPERACLCRQRALPPRAERGPASRRR